MKTRPNDAASPSTFDSITAGGLTKRELFALEAMRALENRAQYLDVEQVAKRAVELADALIKKLNE